MINHEEKFKILLAKIEIDQDWFNRNQSRVLVEIYKCLSRCYSYPRQFIASVSKPTMDKILQAHTFALTALESVQLPVAMLFLEKDFMRDFLISIESCESLDWAKYDINKGP